MSRRRWTIALVAAAAMAFVVAYGVVRPAGDEEAVLGVAVDAVQRVDPALGVYGSCGHRGLAALRPKPHRCVVRVCRLGLARLVRDGNCTDVALRP